jgi:hypothetical protein
MGFAMRTVCASVLLGLMGLPPLCVAQSVFNGTWKPDPEIYSPTRKPDVVELVSGVYDCRTCTPPYKVKADGLDQAISGNPYYDTLNIALAGNRTLTKIAKKGGRTVAESGTVVSEDGAMAIAMVAEGPPHLLAFMGLPSICPDYFHATSGAGRGFCPRRSDATIGIPDLPRFPWNT